MPARPPRYPIFLSLAGRRVLVAGAGRVAGRRIVRLLQAGARVQVIAPTAVPDIEALAARGAIDWQARRIEACDIDGQLLFLAVTDDPDVNADMAQRAQAQGILVQRADDAQASDFLVPALVERGEIQIAIASDGAAPTLSRRLRAALETWVPRAYGDLAALAGDFRQRVRDHVPADQRSRFWSRVFDGAIAEHVFAGRVAQARRALESLLADPSALSGEHNRGEVFLVGAGPGDPDLLTFRALRLIQRADVVLYDSLVNPAIVDLVPADAERIHVGKRADRHTLPQPDINTRLVDLALQGKRVLRLKGGDPFVFGRGGEEMTELAAAGVPFQVVPGITAASGCAAYAGIPLTHRDYAQSVVFVTGHLKAGESDLSWPELARPNQTVVFFMARKRLGFICASLQAHGLAPDWPAAMVIDGTTADQQVVAATLDSLADAMRAVRSDGPALLIVGEVVRLHDTLDWFSASQQETAHGTANKKPGT